MEPFPPMKEIDLAIKQREGWPGTKGAEARF
jgi:hypothetical protein